MKLSCTQEDLANAVLKVQRAVAAKSNIAALEGILLKAENQTIELCGYDLSLGIKTRIKANIEKEGSVVLNARLFSELVRRLPEGKVFIENDENLTTNIDCEFSKFSITGITANDFPSLPESKETTELTLPSSTLKNMIKQTLFAVAEEDSKPVQTGTLFEIKENTITLVSVDGFRFALRKENIETSLTTSFVVPGKTLNEVLKLLPDDDNEIQILIGPKHAIFNIESCSVITRLLEGEFLDYNSAIPKTSSTEVIVNTREFISSLERVSLLTTEKIKSPVRCIFSDDQINFSCSTERGRGTDKLIANKKGEDVEIGFNSKYLIETLKNTDSDEIKLEMNKSLGPIKITSIDGDAFIFLVLPVRLSNNI